MNLTTESVEEIRELVSNDQTAELVTDSIKRVSLPAALELACSQAGWHGNGSAIELVKQWTEGSQVLSLATDVLSRGTLPIRMDCWGPREYEFFPVSIETWDGSDHHLFESRFAASLRNAGFGKRAMALAGAFREMADNLIQHSGPSSKEPAKGLLGYHVVDGAMCFAAADVGRGVLASLAENPAWEGLENSVEAIRAIVVDHASRRRLGGEGTGFKQLFKSLADLNGIVTLRSGDGFMRLVGTPEGRNNTFGFVMPDNGFQLSVTSSLGKPVQELLI